MPTASKKGLPQNPSSERREELKDAKSLTPAEIADLDRRWEKVVKELVSVEGVEAGSIFY